MIGGKGVAKKKISMLPSHCSEWRVLVPHFQFSAGPPAQQISQVSLKTCSSPTVKSTPTYNPPLQNTTLLDPSTLTPRVWHLAPLHPTNHTRRIHRIPPPPTHSSSQRTACEPFPTPQSWPTRDLRTSRRVSRVCFSVASLQCACDALRASDRALP